MFLLRNPLRKRKVSLKEYFSMILLLSIGGLIFVYAMLVLSTSGAVMAALKPERVSVIAGIWINYRKLI